MLSCVVGASRTATSVPSSQLWDRYGAYLDGSYAVQGEVTLTLTLALTLALTLTLTLTLTLKAPNWSQCYPQTPEPNHERPASGRLISAISSKYIQCDV